MIVIREKTDLSQILKRESGLTWFGCESKKASNYRSMLFVFVIPLGLDLRSFNFINIHKSIANIAIRNEN